ncbi:hypothetical protein [Sphaerisporangium flaviroseum]
MHRRSTGISAAVPIVARPVTEVTVAGIVSASIRGWSGESSTPTDA